jgi:two-component system, LytTR family, sensor histidine kinase AlgZ
VPTLKSINQTGDTILLPNFCNLGVILRTLVAANLLFAIVAVSRAEDLRAVPAAGLQVAAIAEPTLIFAMVALCALRPALQRLPYALAVTLVIACLGGLGLFSAWAVTWVLPLAAPPDAPRLAVLFALTAGVLLMYFDRSARALAPALGEARLQALQARIRPHFLYNSLNAALSLIRTEPKRAEQALLDVCDLFRVLMADNTRLTTLDREVELTRQYLAIESLRLADRLRIEWQLDPAAADAMVPPLLLQPLVENAVYHGIEPLDDVGTVIITTARVGRMVTLEITNPLPPLPGTPKHGNHMATANIRERLALHFDAEARMVVHAAADHYRVLIEIPYNKAPKT